MRGQGKSGKMTKRSGGSVIAYLLQNASKTANYGTFKDKRDIGVYGCTADVQSPLGLPMRIKLIRKLANVINGVDLANARVGDMLDMTSHDASLLIAEGWAQAVTPRMAESRPDRRKDKDKDKDSAESVP
jgi:hypothetical protein